jgi:hypothetical protein
VSTNSTTSASKKLYLLTGAAGGITGNLAVFGLAAGSFAASGFVIGSACPVTGRLDRSINEELLWLAVYVSARDVSIKSIATPAVIFPKKVPAPEEPKTVWLDPPKAAPMSAPLPAWRSTIRIKTRQATICKIINNAYIKFSLLEIYFETGGQYQNDIS